MGADLTGRVEAWRATGASERFRDHEIWVRSITGDDPVLLLLHGYPSSSYDFRTLLPRFAESAALTFDFLGFGLSDKPRGFAYSLLWQADLVEELVARHFGGRELFLVAHDMGTSVATELLARDIEGEPASLGRAAVQRQHRARARDADARPAPAASRLGPLASRLSSERVFRREFGAPVLGRPPAERRGGRGPVVADLPQRRPDGRPRADRLPARARRVRRALARRDPRLARPLSLAWGLLDPVATTAVLAALRELRPGVPVDELRRARPLPAARGPRTGWRRRSAARSRGAHRLRPRRPRRARSWSATGSRRRGRSPGRGRGTPATGEGTATRAFSSPVSRSRRRAGRCRSRSEARRAAAEPREHLAEPRRTAGRTSGRRSAAGSRQSWTTSSRVSG